MFLRGILLMCKYLQIKNTPGKKLYFYFISIIVVHKL